MAERRGFHGFPTASEYRDFDRREQRERAYFDAADRAAAFFREGLESSGVHPAFHGIVPRRLEGEDGTK